MDVDDIDLYAVPILKSSRVDIRIPLSSGAEYDYDFQLLSIATSLVYAYGIGLPVLLWLALRYLGVGEWGVVEALAVWGYAQFVWVPVSVSVVFIQDFEGESAENFLMDRFCVIPVPLLRWALVFAAFASSGYFLVMNVYPVLASVCLLKSPEIPVT